MLSVWTFAIEVLLKYYYWCAVSTRTEIEQELPHVIAYSRRRHNKSWNVVNTNRHRARAWHCWNVLNSDQMGRQRTSISDFKPNSRSNMGRWHCWIVACMFGRMCSQNAVPVSYRLWCESHLAKLCLQRKQYYASDCFKVRIIWFVAALPRSV